MPVTTATITGDLNALIGELKDARLTVKHSGGSGWHDVIENSSTYGGGEVTLAADGTFSVPLPVTTGTSVRYMFSLTYVDPATRQRKSESTAWGELDGDMTYAEFAENTTATLPPSLGDQLAARIDGGTDYGDVSGVLTLDADNGTHALNATGPLLLTLDPDAPNFRIITLYVASGADQITVDGIADLELTDGAFASFVRIRGAWVLASAGAGGTTAPADTTPPSAVTDLVATGGEGEIVLTWTAATDEESTVKYGWKVWDTTDTEPAEYTIATTPGVTATGLAAGTYNAKVYSYSNGGATTADTATATVTAALVIDFQDTFSRGPSTLNDSPNPDIGAPWTGSGLGSMTITSDGRLKLNDGLFPIATRTVAARELTGTITTTATSTQLSIGTDGVGVALNNVGRVFVGGLTGVSYNITGGTNSWTANGYLPLGTHNIKVTLDGTIAVIYVDEVRVLEGEYTQITSGFKVDLGSSDGGDNTGSIDNVVVKH